MIIYFLLILLVASVALMTMISMISKQALLYESLGMLDQHRFYDFYLHHSFEVNSILFAIVIVLILYWLIHSYFKVLEHLLQVLSGKQIKHQSLYFYLFPQFKQFKQQIESYLDQTIESERLFVESSERKNEMLMYLAHDLKTPLTSMIGYVNYTLDHKLSEELENESIAIAMNKANRLNLLIDEFSQLLMYDDKVNDLNYTKIDLKVLLEYQLSGFIPLLEQKHLSLLYDIQDGLYIRGDYDKLLRVFDNLMRNAMNYASANSEIKVEAYEANQQVYIAFSNDSDTMNEESLKHLFDKFYRQEVARTSVTGGAGLGLAIAKAIIEAHQGEIKASLHEQKITFLITMESDQDE